jgi:RNA polymerase sigma factor (sigma-70 family)
MTKAEFQTLVTRSTPGIRRYFARRSGNPEEIADLTQEAIAALLESQTRFRGTCSFVTWMYTICRNTYGKHVYYAQRRRAIDNQLFSTAPTAEELLSREDEKLMVRSIETFVETLDYASRRLYRWYYLEKRTIREIAETLEKAEGTVKWWLYRLRKDLQNQISS